MINFQTEKNYTDLIVANGTIIYKGKYRSVEIQQLFRWLQIAFDYYESLKGL